ncbi:ABC transporter [Streptomyces daqingensis]|uniref:ABC transporter n=1 Tax=Streptomyces daqingensis TaxID=1472640 RepID=A0ABQ2M9D5_9ACTN|nr:ABC transporter ATP-binding protein [Streptomyces daqingensis]GGO48526.1 ABC transporter [Streptomyces daqingensis]
MRSLLRLWPYVRPVRVRMFAAAFVAILGSCTGLAIPLVLKWLVDGPVADRDTAGVWLGGALLLGVGVLEAALFGFRRWLNARPLASVEAAMRADVYSRLQRLPVSFHDRWPSGQLLSRATTDLQLLRMFLAFGVTFLLVNSVTVVVGCVVLLAQEWTLGLIILGPVIPLVMLCTLFEQRYALAARKAQDQIGDLTTVVEEAVLGIRVIKGFGRHRSQARAFRALSERLLDTELRKARLLAGIWALIMTLPEVAIGAALVLGTVQVSDGELSAGTLVAFVSTALTLRWPIDSFGFLLAMSNESATATDRFFEVMDEPVPQDVLREPGGVKGPDGSGRRDGLRFEGVRFRYPDAQPGSPPVLDGVDLHVRPGETMALVGATGSGKTTLTALVPRLHETTAGRITLDGDDVAALSRAELRSRVAVAFEEPTLFSASVAENVLMGAGGPPSEADADVPEPRTAEHGGWGAASGTLGSSSATAEEEERAGLRSALRVSQAAEFVDALPHGAGTQVGEQGLSLSGGQRQRLALARAVVGQPEFLVLDDPLSALDVHTEAAVEAALREVLATTTALVVAHRPSTVQLADRVALLSDGRIAAVGTHHELLESSAEYRCLMTGERTAGAEAGARGPGRLSAADPNSCEGEPS